LVDTAGRLIGGPVPIAHTASFEGDTQFGGDVAFEPVARRFFSSFGTDTGMGGQETLASVAQVGPQVVIGTGFYTSLNNAADPDAHRFLTTWEGSVGGTFRVFGQLYAPTLGAAINFTASPSNGVVGLTWRNPTDLHFSGMLIRAGTSGYPAGPNDGLFIVDKPGSGGVNDGFTHANATNWTTYYYAAFAHDDGTNYAPVANAAATPRPDVVTVTNNTFASGADGWTLATWAAGAQAPGVIGLNSGNVVSSGSGASNNRDTCTREGTLMTKAISTVGYTNVQVEYDVMAELNAPPTGSPVGSCSVLEGSIEDKLVVYYSLTGTNGPWNVAQTLVEGAELPTPWIRKFINLAGVAGTANNADFALRFQWQFNSGSDTGRIDNVRILSGAIVSVMPAIGFNASIIERTVPAGTSPVADRLIVNNTGAGQLNFTLTDNATWLSVSPGASSSAGPDRVIAINYTTSALAPGEYEAQIEIASASANNSPQFVTVRLRVIPLACVWEPFSYYDGRLTTMGAANWTGSATNQLVVERGLIKITGGAGVVSATRTAGCAGSNGVIEAQIKIRRGPGTGDFFWNIAFDDASGNNLARWYGGSTIARGRVGNDITADLPLTGTGTWDDLYLRINTTANTSEFFFNGTRVGTISHGATPGNAVGSVKLERLDRSSAVGDIIYFDDLRLGPIGHMPTRLEMTRLDNTMHLSWPATGAGFDLQSTPDLILPWSPVTTLPTLVGGKQTITTNVSAGNGYFRLRAR